MWGILTWLSPALVTPFSRDPRDNGLPRFNVNDSVIIRTTVNVTRDSDTDVWMLSQRHNHLMMSWLLADGIIQHLYRIERKEGNMGNLNICCWHLSHAAATTHFFQLSPKDLYIWGFKPAKKIRRLLRISDLMTRHSLENYFISQLFVSQIPFNAFWNCLHFVFITRTLHNAFGNYFLKDSFLFHLFNLR